MQMHEQHYQQDLGDGYTLRWANANDVASLLDLYGFVFRDETIESSNAYVKAYAAELISGRHPMGSPDDFAVVADANNRIVAATTLMRMPLEYAGVAIPSGRPEIVASHPDVRNRGYIRKIFQLIHAKSTARGDLMQGITGIPYYYRQFGYEYALTLGGSRMVPLQVIPKLAANQQEPFVVRRAQTSDIMQLLMLYERERSRLHNHLPMLVTSRLDASYLRYTMSDVTAHEPWIPYVIIPNVITRPDGDVVGSFWSNRIRGVSNIGVFSLSTEPHILLSDVYPSLCRAMVQIATTIPIWDNKTGELEHIQFGLGVDHPVYRIIEQESHKVNRPYAWYIRVADVAQLIQHIVAPLERRLSQSAMAGYSGELTFDFYRSGLQLTFTKGRITATNLPANDGSRKSKAGYPPHVFLQQLFGLHSIHELKASHPDVYSSGEAEVLLDILFPKQSSWLAPLD